MADQDNQKQVISRQIYDELKAAILELRYLPGSFLSDRVIAQKAGVSRTPVREALKRLSQEGWVVWQERKRAMVKKMVLEDVKEIFFLRQMIEPTAVIAVFEKGEPRHLAGELSLVASRMKKSMDNPILFMKEDIIFHSTIIVFLGNKRLKEIWEKIADESLRIAIYALFEKRRPQDVVQEHEDIVEALWTRDLNLSLKCLKEHHKSIFRAYEQKFCMDFQEQVID
ncbi:MAG: GntR family transcriptional regulator [Caldisericia bacterium]|jgi:DNA-binding GntR family transcriptional regulator|nr:GntR family transcriptional regulator [Caldisericia bacterium]